MSARTGFTFVKKLLTMLVILLLAFTAGCATSKEYRMSLDSYNKRQYQEALEYIEEALAEEPHNQDYLLLKDKINKQIYLKEQRYRRLFLGFQ